ncbi:MAG: type II secretion system protein [Luteolibacter sp.]
MKNPRHLPLQHEAGFTLVELLVAITIILVLAVLSFLGASALIRSAAAAKDTSTMRQFSSCITLYASEHNDYLPGPLFTGQAPVYNKEPSTNIKEWRRLADCFAPYLGYDNPKPGDFIEPMAASWQKSPESRNAPAWYMQQKLPMGDNGTTFENPWGQPAPASANDRVPMKLAAVLAQPKTSRTWAMTELDQLHPDVGNAGWKSLTPPTMTHGSYRLALYFNGSVGKLNQNNDPF